MIAVETKDIYPAILKCYLEDSDIAKYARNSGTLEELAKKEFECLTNVDPSYKFFLIKDRDMLGYFGLETVGKQQYLVSFFIRKEYRNRKKDIWNFVKSHFKGKFYSGLFKVNTRAESFYKSMGGKKVCDIICEDKPAYVFEFGE